MSLVTKDKTLTPPEILAGVEAGTIDLSEALARHVMGWKPTASLGLWSDDEGKVYWFGDRHITPRREHTSFRPDEDFNAVWLVLERVYRAFITWISFRPYRGGWRASVDGASGFQDEPTAARAICLLALRIAFGLDGRAAMKPMKSSKRKTSSRKS